MITAKIVDLGDSGEFFIKLDIEPLIAKIHSLNDQYDHCGDRSIRSDDLRWYEIGFNAARDEIIAFLRQEP